MSRLNNFDSDFKDLLQARKVNRIERYSLENTIKPITVSSHSHWVVILSLIIRKQVERYIKQTYKRSLNYQATVEIATFHDLGECVTGDNDFVAKRAGVIDGDREGEFIHNRFADSELFAQFMESILVDNINDHEWDWEKKIVKCADILEHLIYCYEEQELFGNKSMHEPLKKGVDVVYDNFKELYEQSPLVQEITSRCSNAIKTNPLA